MCVCVCVHASGTNILGSIAVIVYYEEQGSGNSDGRGTETEKERATTGDTKLQYDRVRGEAKREKQTVTEK